MSGFDVHTDKALKELRTRLDQAERERDEAGRAFRNLVAVLDRDGGQRQAGETIAGTLERATRVAADLVAGEPARVAAAEMARDVRWTLAALAAGAEHVVSACLRITMSQVEAIRRTWAGGCALADIAAAIRAARGAK